MSTAAGEHAARIPAADDQWLEATARQDLDGVLAIHVADAGELLPDPPALVGRDAIRAFYARLLDQLPRFARSFTAEEIAVAAAGDLAAVRGSSRLTPTHCSPSRCRRGSSWVCRIAGCETGAR